eukprot:766107-Hanusia_phi.AAC.4
MFEQVSAIHRFCEQYREIMQGNAKNRLTGGNDGGDERSEDGSGDGDGGGGGGGGGGDDDDDGDDDDHCGALRTRPSSRNLLEGQSQRGGEGRGRGKGRSLGSVGSKRVGIYSLENLLQEFRKDIEEMDSEVILHPHFFPLLSFPSRIPFPSHSPPPSLLLPSSYFESDTHLVDGFAAGIVRRRHPHSKTKCCGCES